MRQITTILIVSAFAVYSCGSESSNDTRNTTPSSQARDAKVDPHRDSPPPGSDQLNGLTSELLDVFIKAAKTFPDDSASLYQFYFEWNATRDPEKVKRQVKRMEILISEESVSRYHLVDANLERLMRNVVDVNSISKEQADSLVMLYCYYDYFAGESLFSKLLTDDDNYKLVWKSFEIMSGESQRDTCFISALINLDDCIRTNAELAEAMPDFIVKAIANFPEGFLAMYGVRKRQTEGDFANYISIYDEPDKKLIAIFTEISTSSKNENHRRAAADLLQKAKN
ncbi:MAG: hypothetical protein WD824_04625 [Cyclobacteriaceae bacterium]